MANPAWMLTEVEDTSSSMAICPEVCLPFWLTSPLQPRILRRETNLLW
ncbi:MAG TPA: hypothetical protein PLR65_01215 [Anaerolineales bacterium]|nr:hypothetical protein [Anaerolineales bacterium]